MVKSLEERHKAGLGHILKDKSLKINHWISMLSFSFRILPNQRLQSGSSASKSNFHRHLAR